MVSEVPIPAALSGLRRLPGGATWLENLPQLVGECLDFWSLRPGNPFPGSSLSLVLPVTREDGSDAVLKLQCPHRESAGEAKALEVWNGDGAVRLFASDQERHALLLERCVPGHSLSAESAVTAIDILIGLLPRLWNKPAAGFVSLSEEAGHWMVELPKAWRRAGRPVSRRLIDLCLDLAMSLSNNQGDQVLLHQDLHADNVLSAEREPWLVIDPKPLVGEREFGVAPIVRSHEFGHSNEGVLWRLDRLVRGLGLDRERALAWSFVSTLSWAIDADQVYPRHLETAQWLAEELG